MSNAVAVRSEKNCFHTTSSLLSPSNLISSFLMLLECFFLKVARDLQVSRYRDLFPASSSTSLQHLTLLTISFSLKFSPLGLCDSIGSLLPSRNLYHGSPSCSWTYSFTEVLPSFLPLTSNWSIFSWLDLCWVLMIPVSVTQAWLPRSWQHSHRGRGK